MLSRVAESVYWMSRYIERAENIARMLGVNLQLMLDMPDIMADQWQSMIGVTGNQADFAQSGRAATKDSVLPYLTLDAANHDSIVSCIRKARENARSVREIISSEMWEEINALYLTLHTSDAEARMMSAPDDFIRLIKRGSHLIEGTRNETMPHADAWHFSQMGRYLERADQTTRLLDVKYFLLLPSADHVGQPLDDLQWSAVLRSASGFEAYRKRHGPVSSEAIVEFLLLERDFPRAVRHCVMGTQRSLHALTGTPPHEYTNAAERTLGQLVAQLDYTSAEEIGRGGLHEFIDGLQARFNEVGQEISQRFFNLPPVT